MKYKTGQLLYEVYIDDDGKCETFQHRVRTIRGGWVYAIRIINGITWVKKSTKNGNWGWADNIDYLWRTSCKDGDKFPYLHTTKLGALCFAKKHQVSFVEKLRKDEDDPDYIKTHEKALKTIERMITKAKSQSR